MGTKRNPGKYDCHAEAYEDEPIFTFRAKSPSSPALVRRYAALLESEIAEGSRPPADIEKVNEAYKCADAMELWRAAYLHGKGENAAKLASKLAGDGPSGKILA